MTPTLKETFNQQFPPPERDKLTDLEDMSFAKLKLKSNFKFGLHQLGGRTVTLEHVNPTKGEHKAVLEDPPGLRFTFSNDEDVYE